MPPQDSGVVVPPVGGCLSGVGAARLAARSRSHRPGRSRSRRRKGVVMNGQTLWTPDGDQGDAPESPPLAERARMSRRSLLRVGAGGAAAVGLYAAGTKLGPGLARQGFASPSGLVDAGALELSDSVYTEVFPTSPLVLNPFTDPLINPPVLRPSTDYSTWSTPPGPGPGQQNSF